MSHNIFHTQLLHTTLSTTIFHTPSFTHHLSHTIFVNHLSHTIFHTSSAIFVTPSFTWQAWPALVAGDAAALCVAGVALGHIHLRFTWQAWHLVTSTFVLRGRRGTYGTWSHPPSFCVAGMPLRALGWLRWRAWAGFSRRWLRGTSRGRRHTWSHPPSFCVTGVALMALGWLWWRAGSGGGPVLVAVSGVALGHIHLRFTWQAWHLVTSTFVFRGRRGTYGTGLTLVSLTTLSHTIFVTHHFWPTIIHTPLCHTPSFTHHFVTHNFVLHQLCHTLSFTHNIHTHTHHLSHATLSHTHTPSFFVTHHLSHTTWSHTQLCFTSRSSTTSFVFPSFPVPATTYWKKLPCGVIRSFHFLPKESWLSLELCSSLSEKKCESKEQSHIRWCYVSLIARIHWLFLDNSFAWPLSSLKCLQSFAGQNRVSKISRLQKKNQAARPILQHRAHHPRLLTRHYLLSFTCCSACCTLHIVHHFCNTRTMWYLIPSSSWQFSLTATSEPLECRITQQLVTPSCVSPVLSQACQRMPYTDLH